MPDTATTTMPVTFTYTAHIDIKVQHTVAHRTSEPAHVITVKVEASSLELLKKRIDNIMSTVAAG